MKQCVCGRSATYPYCDGTHKIKKEKPEVKENIDDRVE
jgi:CDGSH-type Zn-finger protein